MARISKDPEERKLELINAAQKFFNEKGFENTLVSDIVKSIGVAQGTFYYYFKSKDDIFSEIAERFLNEFMKDFTLIVDDETLNTIEKAEMLLHKGIELMENNEGVMSYLHTKGNIELHEKVEKKFIEYITPLVVKIVKQGVEERIFNIEYPKEVVTFLMMGSHYLGDVDIYMEDKEEYKIRIKAVLFVAQRVLGLNSETMNYITDKFMAKFVKLLP